MYRFPGTNQVNFQCDVVVCKGEWLSRDRMIIRLRDIFLGSAEVELLLKEISCFLHSLLENEGPTE